MNEQLKQKLNEIITYLEEGTAWHKRVANELRKMPNKRGYARVHEGEGLCDNKFNFELTKLIRDNMMYSPVVDSSYIAKADNYIINDFEGFKQHFKTWIAREDVFLKSITSAIDYARSEDIEIYSCLCSLSKEVKNEMIRAGWLYDSLADCGWEKHHLAVVSKWLHDYMESNPGKTDWNIG